MDSTTPPSGPAVPLRDYLYPPALVRSSEAPEGSRLLENEYATARDGVRIGVDVYVPEGTGPFPVLLSLAPYMKEIQRLPPQWSHAIESGATEFYNGHGYVHVIAQGRGAGHSQGQWRWFDEHELTDGYDIIEWIADQPWCDGNVGMIGASYFSWSQYAAAAAQPPHLRCICICDASIDLYRDVAYQGGILNAGFLLPWIQYHTAMMAWPGPVEGKQPPMNMNWELANHPYDGEWYRQRSARARIDEIEVPVLSIAAQQGILHYRGQLEGWEKITAPKKLMIAPPAGWWTPVHYLTNPALNKQMLRWYDHWLKGIDTGIMDEPQVALFDSATREWRFEAEYPLPRTEWTPWYLSGSSDTDPSGGTLTPDEPEADTPHSYRMPDSFADLMADRAPLTFTSPPRDEELVLAGRASVCLHASSTQPDTAFWVRLYEIDPGGNRTQLLRGCLKASFRAVDETKSSPGAPWHPFDEQELLEPGRIYEFHIEMQPIFRTLRPGYRLQLEIASEELEYNNPNRNVEMSTLPWPVVNTIHHDGDHPSHVLLPVTPPAAPAAPMTDDIASIDWPLYPGKWKADTEGFPLRP